MLNSNVITSRLVVKMVRNKSTVYLMVYVLLGLVAIGAVVPWGRPALSSYEFEVVDQHLQHPIVAETGQTIAVVFNSTVRPPRDFKPYRPQGHVNLLAFKMPEATVRTPVLASSSRIYKTSLLDKKFVNKLLHRAPVVQFIKFKPNMAGAVVSTVDIHDVTLFTMLLPPGYDSASYEVESLRKRCPGRLIKEPSGLTVARQASGCIYKHASLEGFALQSPSGFYTAITCFEGRQGPTHCDMETMYKSRQISIEFDARRVNDWRDIQREVIAWLNDQLVFEINTDLGEG